VFLFFFVERLGFVGGGGVFFLTPPRPTQCTSARIGDLNLGMCLPVKNPLTRHCHNQ
jgi:hypothetical protein